jgi:hypothetical protein
MERKNLRKGFHTEVLAKLFFELTEERYPSSEKVNLMVARLINPLTSDPLENVHMKISILNAVRNMVKEVSPTKLYRSLQHRDDLYLAIIEASEDAEDILEEIEENLLQEED